MGQGLGPHPIAFWKGSKRGTARTTHLAYNHLFEGIRWHRLATLCKTLCLPLEKCAQARGLALQISHRQQPRPLNPPLRAPSPPKKKKKQNLQWNHPRAPALPCESGNPPLGSMPFGTNDRAGCVAPRTRAPSGPDPCGGQKKKPQNGTCVK